MKCPETRDKFSPLLDGELSTEETKQIEKHLAECEKCQQELKELLEVSNELKLLGQETAVIKAPEGFEKQVMQQIAQIKKQPNRGKESRRWITGRFSRLVACAATLAIMAYGALELIPQVFNQGSIVNVAKHPAPDNNMPGVAINNTSPTPVNNDSHENSAQTGNDALSNINNQQDNTTNTDSKPDLNTSNPQDPNTPVNHETPGGSIDNINSNNTPGQNEDPLNSPSISNDIDNEYKELVFLNQEREITSTLLQMQVEDLILAQKQAESTGEALKVKPQMLYQQASGENPRVILRYVVPYSQANTLLENLTQLGVMVSQQEEKQDISERFATTVEQYRALIAQLNGTQDPEQKKLLSEQVKTLERQLVTWDEEAENHIILLTLET